jgi:anti-sigma regulatory factor (Ser/Thr protein kinase)
MPAGTASTLPAGVLELNADASQLTAARRFAESAAESFGFEDKERYEVTFAVNEAVSNAIEHGRASREGTIRMRAAEEEGALVFYVGDSGRFIPKMAISDELPERGRGLDFMRRLMDHVDVRPGPEGTVLRFAIRP